MLVALVPLGALVVVTTLVVGQFVSLDVGLNELTAAAVGVFLLVFLHGLIALRVS